MRLWYWLRKDLKEDQSRAKWVRFQRFSVWRTEEQKARRVGINPAIQVQLHSFLNYAGSSTPIRTWAR